MWRKLEGSMGLRELHNFVVYGLMGHPLEKDRFIICRKKGDCRRQVLEKVRRAVGTQDLCMWEPTHLRDISKRHAALVKGR